MNVVYAFTGSKEIRVTPIGKNENTKEDYNFGDCVSTDSNLLLPIRIEIVEALQKTRIPLQLKTYDCLTTLHPDELKNDRKAALSNHHFVLIAGDICPV